MPKLGRRCKPCAHELHFIEHPKRVVVEEREFRGPARPPGGVASHQGPRNKHILRADQDCRLLRRLIPTRPARPNLDAAHQEVEVCGTREIRCETGLCQAI
jgi:hypothetical protein